MVDVMERQRNMPGRVVGIVKSPESLRIARAMPAAERPDLLEWRADSEPGLPVMPDLGVPWILTARHPAEGGENAWGLSRRRLAYLGYLEIAHMLDIEVRSLRHMAEVVKMAQHMEKSIIASFHDFRGTPSLRRLEEIAARGRDEGASVIKIATLTESSADIATLLRLLERAPQPMAVMGMGRLGAASRLLFAQCGSCLNYGWIDSPNVPGQWSAADLKRHLDAPTPTAAHQPSSAESA
jgi:3-dehydroquinate dehydratase-1